MNIGKLTSEDLSRLVFRHLKRNRTETMKYPAIGEDVSYVALGDEVMVLSTDPITGAAEDIGSIAVHIACNDVAAGGGEAIAIMLTLLAPPRVTEEQIEQIVKQAQAVAEELQVDIVGGHTEVTRAVNRIVLSTTVIGKAIKILPGVQVGDAIVMTKSLGLEGSAILAKDKAEMKAFLSATEYAQALAMSKQLSIVPEAAMALQFEVHAMHDITEGGLIGALCEIVYDKAFGFEVEIEKVNIPQVTRKIAQYYKIDPYQLISSGALLIALAPAEAEALCAALNSKHIAAAVIGRFTPEKQTAFIEGGRRRQVHPKEGDELYRVIDHDEE